MKPLEKDGAVAKQCVQCGKCLSACPLFAATAREEFSPKAKQVLARLLEEGGLQGRDAADLAKLCLACGRCEKACPYGLCAPDVVAALRAAHPAFEQWLWKTWIEKGDLLWPALATVARFAPGNIPGDGARAALAKLKALGPASDRAIAPWLRPTAWDRPRAAGAERGRATVFPGCTAARLKKGWTRAAERCLEALGYELAPEPAWRCCGCTLGHAGLAEAQAAMQRANLAAWRAAGRPVVAVFCATCRCGLRAYARLDLGWAPGEAQQWLESVKPLGALYGATAFEVLPGAPERLVYHTPCHGSGHGSGAGGSQDPGKGGGNPDAAFLRRAVGGIPVVVGADRCCGMGGVMQLAAPDLSARVAARAWEGLGARPGDQVVTGCSGCVMQLAATAPQGVRVGHWLELISLG